MGIYVRTRSWMELHLHLGQMVGGTGDGREGTRGTPGQLAVPFTLRSLLYRHLSNLHWAQFPCVVPPLPEDIFGLCHSLASPYRRGAHNTAVMTKSRLLRGGSAEPLRAALWIQAASLAPTTFVTLSELFNLCFCFSLCKKSVWEEKYLAVLKWDCHGVTGGKIYRPMPDP